MVRPPLYCRAKKIALDHTIRIFISSLHGMWVSLITINVVNGFVKKNIEVEHDNEFPFHTQNITKYNVHNNSKYIGVLQGSRLKRSIFLVAKFAFLGRNHGMLDFQNNDLTILKENNRTEIARQSFCTEKNVSKHWTSLLVGKIWFKVLWSSRITLHNTRDNA